MSATPSVKEFIFIVADKKQVRACSQVHPLTVFHQFTFEQFLENCESQLSNMQFKWMRCYLNLAETMPQDEKQWLGWFGNRLVARGATLSECATEAQKVLRHAMFMYLPPRHQTHSFALHLPTLTPSCIDDDLAANDKKSPPPHPPTEKKSESN